MKAIFPCAYYIPERAASMYITDNIVHACAENGIEVFLYTPTPTRNVPEGTTFKRKEDLCNGMLNIKRFHMYKEGTNSVLRAFRYILCEIVQLHYCMWKKYDVAFIDSTPPIQGLKLGLVKAFRKKPVIYNAQDIFPDSLVGTGLTHKGSFIWKIGRKIENFTYWNADKIIVISEDFKKNIMAKGVPEEKIEVIYNWVDEEAVKNIPRGENPLFDQYGLDRKKFYITYCGNIGLTQNMDMLLEAAEELQSVSDIQFVLIGEGAYKTKVKELIAIKNLQNVTLLSFQPYEMISQVFSLGNVGLVISKPGVGANSVPSKTWSILSASRPVLANFDENELKSILEKNGCGVFTKAGDKGAFKEAIMQLYNDSELCREYGRNGRQFILQNLTRKIGTQKYIEVIKKFGK